MTETPPMSIYEKAFAKSDKTDAILVIDGKKLHVNKAVLSYHSDYFNALFNSEFKEKSMEEIEIKDINFEGFATALSLVHSAPIKFDQSQVERHLKVVDQFQLLTVKHHLEVFLLTFGKHADELIELADKYQLNDLMDSASQRPYMYKREFFKKLSKETNIRLFHRLVKIDKEGPALTPVRAPSVFNYESKFAKTDKTDAILMVQGKKFHVNKAVLSYHSDYFNTLFNSDLKEEYPIENVNFKEFAILLSFVYLNPIVPTKVNAEKVLELAERFQIPSIKNHLKPHMIAFDIKGFEKLRIGYKYGMNDLIQNGIENLQMYENMTEEVVETDAVLVVDGKKLHVNKMLLSCHSDYFNMLFNSESKEEYPIENVNFEEFAILLSCVHQNPIPPTKENAENVLQLAERFQIPSIKNHLESFMSAFNIDGFEIIRIADKYGMDYLLENGMNRLKISQIQNLTENVVYQELSTETKLKMFKRYMDITEHQYCTVPCTESWEVQSVCREARFWSQ